MKSDVPNTTGGKVCKVDPSTVRLSNLGDQRPKERAVIEGGVTVPAVA